MKVSLQFASLILAVLATAPLPSRAETRMQVAAASSPVRNQASSGGQAIGTVASGEILFVSRVEGDWAAISPPERFDLWLNKDFIEGNRVVAKVIQVRSGPGIQHPVVGTLERGAPVMPRGESGDWCKIAPPSSCVLWVNRKDLEEVRTHTTPIQEVTAVTEPKKPAPKPQAPPPAPKRVPKKAPVVIPEPAPKPAAQPTRTPPPLSPAPVRVSPSQPKATPPATAKPAVAAKKAPPSPLIPTQAPVVTHKAPVKPTMKASPKKTKPASPTLHPATALPPPAKKTRTRRRKKAPPESQVVPPPSRTVASKKPANVEVPVDPDLVDGLDLADVPNQGKSVQVEGEVRNAPFLTASPSRYRLLDYDGRVLEMVCHLHGDSTVLRQYVGKGVSIRGREYWVESSDMPVVVVGEIAPLAPSAAASEPVLF